MKNERFEQRIFRIFAQAGYSPIRILTATPEQMVEIPDITVPEIRAVLCMQNKVLAEHNLHNQDPEIKAILETAQKLGGSGHDR